MEKTLIHNFNLNTLIIDKEIKELFDREINLLLTPMEVEENAVVGAIWDTAGDNRVCPLCEALDGQIFPVESPEFARLEPPIHISCRCILRYQTGQQRGIEERLKEYRPVDSTLLEKWSSKIYTDAEIREMVKNVSEHTVIREKMAEFGNKYGNTEVERGIALDVNGKEILSKTGTSDSIYFPFDERELMKNRNLTFIHNHPSGASFSPDDILFAQEVNFKEMIVVGSKYRYTISSKVPRIWPSTEKLKAAHKIQVDKYESWYFFNTKSVAGKPPVLTKNEAWVQITHKIWQTLAKDFYLNYKRILI